MNNLKIDKIVARNFKSIGGMKTRLDLSDKGLVHVQGKNGLGKSTLLSVIAFGIFGRNVDLKSNSKSSLPVKTLVNDINKKELEVEIHLSNEYSIYRGIQPDYFYIEYKGERLDQRSGKPIDQDYLENEILGGLSFPSFMSTIYLSSKALSTPFLYMTPTQRKEFIEELLDLRIIYYMNEVVKKKTSENKLDLLHSKGRIDDLNASIASASSSIMAQEEKKKEIEERKNVLAEGKKREFRELVESGKKDIDGHRFSIEMARKELSQLGEDIATLEESIAKSGDLEAQIDSVKTKCHKLDLQKSKMSTELEMNTKQLETFAICGDCPKKSHFVSVNFQEEYDTFIERYNEFKGQFESELKVLEHKQSKIASQKDKLQEARSSYRECELTISSHENKIQTIQATLIREKNQLDEFIESLNQTIEIDYSHLEYLKKEYVSVERGYDGFVQKSDDLAEIKQVINDKAIKEEIIQHYVPIFEKKVNDLLSQFMADDDFSFNVSIDSQFNVDGKKNGKAFNIFGLSNGQLNSVHFAFLFGFLYILELKNLTNFDMLFIDELMDSSGLDSDRLQYILDYIKTLSKEKDVYVITHNQTINTEMFDSKLLVDKVDKFTEYSWVA